MAAASTFFQMELAVMAASAFFQMELAVASTFLASSNTLQ
jgi:hypothetical protein